MKTIKWLLFHEPAELFIRTAEHFEKEINKLTGDKFSFQIMHLTDYENDFCDGQSVDPVMELKEGRVDICQLHSSLFPLYNASDFAVFDLPFLFESHDHATRVFEGEIGSDLLDHVEDTVGVKGLGFTYSGGYMCIKSDTLITSVDQIKQLSVAPRQNPINADMWKRLGINIKQNTLNFNVSQTTLPRFHADGQPHQRYCIDTGHSMYLTMIFMNQNLWNSFDKETQDNFKKAAYTCARTERKQSVQDADDIRNSKEIQAERNIESITKLPQNQQAIFETLLADMKEKWEPYFSEGLVKRILSA